MFVLLDNSSGAGALSLLFAEPKQIIRADDASGVADAIQLLETALGQGLYAAGYFSYELGYVLEPRLASRMPAERRVPLLWFGVFEAPRRLSEADVLGFLDAPAGNPHVGPVTPCWSAEDYARRFAMAHDKIASGDIYQLNLTFKIKFRVDGSPLAFYRDLRLRQPVQHGAIVDAGDVTVLSLSPEQFFTRDGQTVTSRPMKGTAARGATKQGDEDARKTLALDPKQRAENLMIVDLMRNDIGRLAEIGSVAVSDLYTVETFSTLHQMTSGVTAQLRNDVDLKSVLKALFPPGSITGAPKIRAMELISELESEARGIYCGAIGYFGPGPVARFNVAIRTPVIFAGGEAEMGIGSGVVADSDAQSEYDECLLKMKFLNPESAGFELIETLLVQSGNGYWLLDRHLERLAASSRHFGFTFHETKIRDVLAAAATKAGPGNWRMRLLLAPNGEVTVATTPAPEAQALMHWVLAPEPVSSSDIFLRHKTTRRHRYDDDWQRLANTQGADDVLYRNERGELTEGSRTNVFIERGGRLLTPPIGSGLLPGVLRAELLATGRAVEHVLDLADLSNGDAVYLGNSVRGLVKAKPRN